MANRSLREALHDPLGNVLVFTREDETPIRLQFSLFEKAPGLKSFFLNPNYQRRMQRRHKFLQNGRPGGIEYILDLVPPSEGEEAVDAVENMYCPPSVQRWKCQLEGLMDAMRPWVEDDDGGEYWLRKSDQEIALERFRVTHEVAMKKKKKEAEEMASLEAATLALEQDQLEKEKALDQEELENNEALHPEQHNNAQMDVEEGLYLPWEEYCHNRNEYVRAQPPTQAPAARPDSPRLPDPSPMMPTSPTISVSPAVPASLTISAPPPPGVEEAEGQQEGGDWYDQWISDNDEDTLDSPPVPAALPPGEEVHLEFRSETEKQQDTLLHTLLKAVEKCRAMDSPAATWNQPTDQLGPALLATGYQSSEPSESFGAPGTPRPRRLSGSSSASDTEVPQVTIPPGERDYEKDLETAKALSLQHQKSIAQDLSAVEETIPPEEQDYKKDLETAKALSLEQRKSIAQALSAVEEKIPPAYSRARHSGAIERILAIMCGEDPHIYSAPMWYTIYRVALTLSCEALVVDHILLWLYASPGFIELFTPLCVQIATDLCTPALYRECFALCVAREISSSTPLHPVNLADFPKPTRVAVITASASYKKRLDQTWEYLTSLKWLDTLAHFPKLDPGDAETIKIYLRARFNAFMEDGIESHSDTPFAPPAPHPSVPLDIYNTWRHGVNNECTPQTRHYNAYVWLQVRDLRWKHYEMPDFGLDRAIKQKLRAIADDVLHNDLSEPSDFMMLLGLNEEQWACMPAWARGEEEEEAKRIVQLQAKEGRERGELSEMGEREFECGSEPSDLGKFECGSEPSDLAQSVGNESWDEVSEVGSVPTIFESAEGMDDEDMMEDVDELTEENEDLGLEEDDGWDTDMTIS